MNLNSLWGKSSIRDNLSSTTFSSCSKAASCLGFTLLKRELHTHFIGEPLVKKGQSL